MSKLAMMLSGRDTVAASYQNVHCLQYNALSRRNVPLDEIVLLVASARNNNLFAPDPLQLNTSVADVPSPCYRQIKNLMIWPTHLSILHIFFCRNENSV